MSWLHTCFPFSRNTINYHAGTVRDKIIGKKGKQTNHKKGHSNDVLIM